MSSDMSLLRLNKISTASSYLERYASSGLGMPCSNSDLLTLTFIPRRTGHPILGVPLRLSNHVY